MAAQEPEVMLNDTRELVVSTQAEISATTLAAEVEALVKAKFALAVARPRDLDMVRSRILRDCARPGFARAARYSVPRANTNITGPSIRFAETCVRAMGNVDVSVRTIFEDADRRKLRIDVIDLESNAGYSSEIILQKVVERRELRKGQRPIGQRVNSTGQVVYLVEATEDEMLMKGNAAVSKAIRTNGLRLVPADIVEEAMAECVQVARKADAADPDSARRRVLDAFDALGVSPSELKAYLGCDASQLQPQDLQHLRELYSAIESGVTTWRDARAAKAESEGADKAGASSAAAKAKAAVAQRAAAAKADEPTPMTPEEQAEIEKRERAEGAK